MVQLHSFVKNNRNRKRKPRSKGAFSKKENPTRAKTPPQNHPGSAPALIKKTGNVLLKSVEDSSLLRDWTNKNPHELVQYIELEKTSVEFRQIKKAFRSSAYGFYLDKIERVENHFLLAGYLLKKEELLLRKNSPPKHKLMFHGTKEENVENICKHNFDWRKNGTSEKGPCWHGKGVYFAPKAKIATQFSDKRRCRKVMLVALVLRGNCWVRNKKSPVPPDGFDTTTKKDRSEFVKYDDNEFYPLFKITYHQKEKYSTLKTFVMQAKSVSLISLESLASGIITNAKKRM